MQSKKQYRITVRVCNVHIERLNTSKRIDRTLKMTSDAQTNAEKRVTSNIASGRYQ